MEFRQLRYYLSIVEFGNMTRAARMLHVAQPALSQQVMNLEAELGMRLLDRSIHGVKPTRAGDLFYRHAKSILRQIEDTRALLQREGESPSGDVRIGLPASSARIMAIPLLAKVRSAYPGIRLELVECRSADIPQLVEQYQIDMAIVVDSQPRKGLLLAPLLVETLYAVLPGAWKAPRNGITLAGLAKLPLVLPAMPNTLRERVDIAFLQKGLEYELVAEISATSLLAQAARAELGATVLPWSAIGEEAQAGQLQVVALSRPQLHRRLSLCISDELKLSAAADAVRLLVRTVLKDLLKSGCWRGTKLLDDNTAAE